ncbi:RNA-binding protein 15-like [Saccoglossus kowalevskii]|uniref:RNA-binding protein 15-like n=1 Tax=Saccoglossus kowalevskii TaxID=10224 RepID=A0ABM0H1I4_SACKO|nr:PREDICTED: putative RNA-binding protein 15-like [Saccoglossus kowalevskii]
MKRQQDRHSHSKHKRSKVTPDMRDRRSRDRISQESDHERREGRSKASRGSHGKNEKREKRDRFRNDRDVGRDAFDRDRDSGYVERMNAKQEYRTLKVSNFSVHVSDMAIKDALYHEFKKFGEVNVRLTYTAGDERVAYVNFRVTDGAREARRAKTGRLVLFDRTVDITPVYLPHDHGPIKQRSLSPDNSSYANRNTSPPRRMHVRHGSLPREVTPRERNYTAYDNNRQQRNYGNSNDFFTPREQHMLPEDDQRATRTLFVGNLEAAVAESELRRVFDRFGIVEDVDVKRPMRGQGNAYAFVKFLNLDMAHKAKVAMSGQYLGRNICKIGYGKPVPTTRLWVGGLGPWTSLAVLEREFDRFGAIRKIDYIKGDNHAYISYDSLDASQAACSQMRGFPLGGPDRRLRVDFADPESIVKAYPVPHQYSPPHPRHDNIVPDPYRRNPERGMTPPLYRDGELDHWGAVNAGGYSLPPPPPLPPRRDEWPIERDHGGMGRHGEPDWDRGRRMNDIPPSRARDMGPIDRRKRAMSPIGRNSSPGRIRDQRKLRSPIHERDFSPEKFRDSRHISPSRLTTNKRDISPKDMRTKRHRSSSSDGWSKSDRFEEDSKMIDKVGKYRLKHDKKGRNRDKVEEVDNLNDLAGCFPVAWHGSVVLKNSAFATRMHLIGGDPSVVDTLLCDSSSSDSPVLRITQRLRLDQPKLEEVTRRISSAGSTGYCLLLALSGSQQNVEEPNQTQMRPLRNLVSYLQQKQAAGVISLPSTGINKDKEREIGVLHAFPPCEFSHKYLLRVAPSLGEDPSKEDHLVVIIVRGAA